jgi:hypothetical protein
MNRKSGKLETLRIPEPCSVGWENMTGDDKIRFCNQCNKQVFNLSVMTHRQAEAIIAATRGNLCARIATRTDDNVLTAQTYTNPLPNLHQISRRALPIASAVISAMMTFNPSMAAQTHPLKTHQGSTRAQKANPKAKAQAQNTTASLSGTVFDWQKAVIVGAKVTLLNASTNVIETVIFSTDEGTFHFKNLRAGSYNLKIEIAGFLNHEIQEIYLQQNQQRKIEIPMEVSGTVEGGAVVSSPPQSLQALCAKSDLIAAAIAGESVEVETDDYPATLMKTELQVSSTLKGNPEPVVYVYHYVYQGDLREFAKGNQLLLFLQKNKIDKQKKGGYEVTDANYEIKKLSDADLAIYRERIEELAKIVQKENNQTEMLEWLIRCAEHQATRFEGAYELANSVSRLSVEDEKEEAEKTSMDSQTVTVNSENNSDSAVETAALLTKKQKERLMDALFSTQELSVNDKDLIRLARAWKDEKLLPFLLSKLYSMQETPTDFAPEIMSMIYEIVNDAEISEALNAYNGISGKGTRVIIEETIIRQEQIRPEEEIKQKSAFLKKFLVAVEGKMKR